MECLLGLSFIYRGLPYLPAQCEPLIACSYHSILTSWTLPSKDLQDPQSWEWMVNSEQYNSRRCLWTPAVKIPRLLCSPPFLAPGFNNVWILCRTWELFQSISFMMKPVWDGDWYTRVSMKPHCLPLALFFFLHTGYMSSRLPVKQASNNKYYFTKPHTYYYSSPSEGKADSETNKSSFSYISLFHINFSFLFYS